MSYPSSQSLLKKYRLSPKHSWGQNFLEDPRVLSAIREAGNITPEDIVIELGGGLGALTAYLKDSGAKLWVYERDPELVEVLQKRWEEDQHYSVRLQDISHLDYATLKEEAGQKLIVMGNLPYHLSSRLMVALCEARQAVKRVVVMVQKEVAERVIAEPGGRDFGLLSVLVQVGFNVEWICLVGKNAFTPPPKVDSAVLALSPRSEGWSKAEEELIIAAARIAFASRRKTLRNSLKNATKAESEGVEKALSRAGIDAQARAETLSLSHFLALGQALEVEGLL